MSDRVTQKREWSRKHRGKGQSRDEQIAVFRAEFGSDEEIYWKLLNDRQRTVLSLWLQGKPFEEICQVLKMSRQTVNTAKNEAVKVLRSENENI